MNSREKILLKVEANQPLLSPLPEIIYNENISLDLVTKFKTVATAIGSKIYEVQDYKEIRKIISQLFPDAKRVFSCDTECLPLAENYFSREIIPHSYNDIDVAIIKPFFAIAENGAVWVTEHNIAHRVIPFIAQHLVVIINAKAILPSMHDAYNTIADADYGYAVFIAGPSKTADIEQSLVLGAHGPRSSSVFIIS